MVVSSSLGASRIGDARHVDDWRLSMPDSESLSEVDMLLRIKSELGWPGWCVCVWGANQVAHPPLIKGNRAQHAFVVAPSLRIINQRTWSRVHSFIASNKYNGRVNCHTYAQGHLNETPAWETRPDAGGPLVRVDVLRGNTYTLYTVECTMVSPFSQCSMLNAQCSMLMHRHRHRHTTRCCSHNHPHHQSSTN